MAPFSRISSYLNSTVAVPHWQDNTTGPGPQPSHAYYALCYCILIVVIVFGNILVCLAVLKERSLQTTTNYLVVSLAVADLLVATLVMPWVVYLEVTGGVWNFSRVCCDIFVTMDVMMCTASILNLCAISIDRYTAVVMPVHYQYSTGPSSCRRVSVMIAMVWLLAFAVSCPLLFGFNTTEDPSICSISNPNFVIYSSVVSFYLPFLVTLLLYVRIYIVLRQRQRKRVLTRQGSQRVKACYKQQQHTEIKALHQRPPDALSCCLQLKSSDQKLSTEKKPLTPTELQQYCSFCHEASISTVEDKEAIDLKIRRKTSCLEVRKLNNGQTATSLRLPSQQHRIIQLRERKATQMLAIVLGTFIVCWLPFFLTHILNTHCQACHISPELYGATIWLGYVNSALNPIIYTTFNSEFRKAFLKILYC
ncbi:PREDICTED: D(3) dopamine receptor [Gekko japonicus]|uniref:D(3) dopamine receptor n=1 Tax=Gekko japonicus TaxID=146911 RepID=A0ABM1K5S2_GEKJA|nr:PREDICTED: D(3) dopamine receptor [Gekko japonicus]